MKDNRTKSIVFLVMLSIALLVGVILVRQKQDIRKGAYFAQTSVQIKPDGFSVAVGDVLPVQIWVVTGADVRVDGVQPYVCFGSELVIDGVDVKKSVEPNADVSFGTVTMGILDDELGCVKFQVASVGTGTEDLPTGAFKAATLNLRAVAEGSGSISLSMDKTKISGRNTDLVSNDMAIAVTSVAGADYDIVAGSGDGLWANYKVSFIGVKPANKCANDWRVKLVALSGDTQKEYLSIPLTKTDETNDKGEVVFSGSKELSGFSIKDNVALFFKGPKHLQVKYGKQDQTELYNLAGGELSLSGDVDSSLVYNFSGYPMLAGDVDGNGVVDGVDFSLVKAKAIVYEQVADGGDLVEDLDGSCQVNNIDVRLLIESLNEKQDQIY